MAEVVNKIDKWLEEGRGGYSTEELQEAFRKVADPDHWKNDIDAEVSADLKDILQHAVPWHTGGGVEFFDAGEGRIRVVAPGYWSNGMEG